MFKRWFLYLNEEGDAGAGGAGAGDPPADGAAAPDAGDVASAEGAGASDAGDNPGDGGAAGAEKPAPGEGEKGEGDDKPSPDGEGVPEEYAAFELPEGFQMDETALQAAVPVFKELELTQAQAQKLVSLQAQYEADRVEAQRETFQQTLEGWITEAQADSEIGGDKWDQTTQTAQLAVNKLGTPELKAFLEESGAGNHPELIRFAAKIGALLHADDPDGGDNPPGKQKSAVEIMYPTAKAK